MPDPSASGDDWEALLPRLLLWARRLHDRVLADVRGAPTPEDLVQDAVTDVLTGRRSRPEGVPLAVLLYGVIRSRASQVLSRAKARGETEGPRYVGLDEAEAAHAEAAHDPAHAADLRERVLALVADDEVLTRMVGLWFEDPALKAADLAALLDLPAVEVYAAARRLRRKGVARAALGLDRTACVGPAALLWRNDGARWPLSVPAAP